MIHLVNHATDMGIDSLRAAGLISTIGLVSITGRPAIGAVSARIGVHNALLVCIVLCLAALSWLFFCTSGTQFFIFAVLFGFAYGAEVPLIPLLLGHSFGIRYLATLIGVALFIGNFAAAMGPLAGGRIYDLTVHYYSAFASALAATVLALAMAWGLKRRACRDRKKSPPPAPSMAKRRGEGE